MDMLADVFRVFNLILGVLLFVLCCWRGGRPDIARATKHRIIGLALLALGLVMGTLQHIGDGWIYGLPITSVGLAWALHGMRMKSPADTGHD